MPSIEFWSGWWDEPGANLVGACYITEEEERQKSGVAFPLDNLDIHSHNLMGWLKLFIGRYPLASYRLVKEESTSTKAILRYEKKNYHRRVVMVRQFELELR